MYLIDADERALALKGQTGVDRQSHVHAPPGNGFKLKAQPRASLHRPYAPSLRFFVALMVVSSSHMLQ